MTDTYSDGERERRYIEAHTAGRVDELQALIDDVCPNVQGVGVTLREMLIRRRDRIARFLSEGD